MVSLRLYIYIYIHTHTHTYTHTRHTLFSSLCPQGCSVCLSFHCCPKIGSSVSSFQIPYVHVCKLSHFSCVSLFATQCTVACQASLSMGFSRQEYQSGLLCPPSGDLPHPRMEPASLMSPSLAGSFLPPATLGKPQITHICINIQHLFLFF